MHIPSLITVVHKSSLSRNEEKVVALLVYFSLVRVATSSFRIVLYSLLVAVE